MAFREVTDKLDGSDSNIIRVFENSDLPVGCAMNAQFIRQYKDKSWVLEMRAGFIKFKIPLQKYEVDKIVNDDFVGGVAQYTLEITNFVFEPWDFSK